MPASITIPISIFEMTVLYAKPEIRLLADRMGAVQELFTAFAPWNPRVDDMEVLTAGKPSEQGIKIKIPNQNASFFFGPTSCTLTKDPVRWSEAARIFDLLDVSLKALSQAAGVTYGRRTSVLSLHLQPTTISFREILRKFMVNDILALDAKLPKAMAIVARWESRRITLDGSAQLANGIFLQTEREFDDLTSFEDLIHITFQDEQELFKLLDVQEVDA